MKVWILNHYANSPDFPGGTRHFDLARELVAVGHELTIFASAFNQKLRRKVHLAESSAWGLETIEGVNFVWLDTFPYRGNTWRRGVSMVSYMVRAYAVGRRLPRTGSGISAPDIVIGSSVHPLAVVAAYYLARLFKAHFVMEVRDLWPQTLVDMGALAENGLITHGLRWSERFLYKRAERIIVLMPGASEYVANTGVDPANVYWIPNGVHLYSLSDVTELSSQDGAFIVMYLGAHGEANGLHTLLRAARLVQDREANVRFVLVGDGPEKPNLTNAGKRLQLSNVEFRDAVPKSKVPATLAQSDALLFTLRDIDVLKYGISPNKLFDYLAAAKPIIFSCNAENNVVQRSGSGVSVPAEDAELLANAIIQLYEKPPEERYAMGARGRAYVEQHYDTRLLARRLRHMLEGLISE